MYHVEKAYEIKTPCTNCNKGSLVWNRLEERKECLMCGFYEGQFRKVHIAPEPQQIGSMFGKTRKYSRRG